MIISKNFFIYISKADPTHMDRYEDDIIAWLWRVYIETKGNDPFILPYLPMTKVRKANFSNCYFLFVLRIFIGCLQWSRDGIGLSS